MDNFLPSEVVPCNATDRSAIYELDPDGGAYANIYELRKVKNKTCAAYCFKLLLLR